MVFQTPNPFPKSIYENVAYGLRVAGETDREVLCRLLKQRGSVRNIPVLMLTSKAEEVDRIVGLELGADDYVVKPFSPRELVLRVKAILRRSGGRPRRRWAPRSASPPDP